MMARTIRISRGAFILGVALSLLAGAAGEARAEYYAYATERVSNLVFTGATIGTLGTGSQSNAAQSGGPAGSESHTDLADALQSYVGTARPAENTFTPLGQVNPNYVRGDSQITSAFTLNTVAEGYNVFPSNSAGAGSVSLSAPITLSAAGAVTLSGSFAYVLSVVQQTIGGGVSASTNFDFTIQNAAGQTVFDFSPSGLNSSFSLTAPGSAGGLNSGSWSATSGTLAAGTYQATLIVGSRVFLSAVPEPSSVLLMGLGLVAALALARRTRRRHQMSL